MAALSCVLPKPLFAFFAAAFFAAEANFARPCARTCRADPVRAAGPGGLLQGPPHGPARAACPVLCQLSVPPAAPGAATERIPATFPAKNPPQLHDGPCPRRDGPRVPAGPATGAARHRPSRDLTHKHNLAQGASRPDTVTDTRPGLTRELAS
jgi:hypothetical protein